MKKTGTILSLLFLLIASISAEDVERQRPADWEGLVYGGRFMDRFLPLPAVGKLSSDTWGLDAVKPRHIDNGIESGEWSYWGGNIHIDSEGKHHLFVCRWREDDPKGHMAWPKSEVVHAVSDHSMGPYKVVEVIGEGHNPEFWQLSDGSYFLYAQINWEQKYYHSNSLMGPWTLHDQPYDNRQRQIVDHMSNHTFTKREDGSMLMVARGGGVWISETGRSPYKQVTAESVYPPYEGKYEDPVIWKTNIQYHLIVNDWMGRIAYYMRSKDGVNWKLDPGEAYLPGIAFHEDGSVEEWYKFERIKVLQDKYGRAYQANFAVCDTVKREDLGSDNHSSKNIAIPLTVGRLIELLDQREIVEKTPKIRLLVKAEEGFNPQLDIDIGSLRFGAAEEVDYGRGCKVLETENSGKDLLITFEGDGNGLTDENFAAKLLGKNKKGELLYGFARLPWLDYNESLLSSNFPEFTVISRKLNADLEIENFGQVKSEEANVSIEYRDGTSWKLFAAGKIPPMDPYQKCQLRFSGDKIVERNQSVEVRVTISQKNRKDEELEGPVIMR